MAKRRVHLVKSLPLQISYCQRYDVAWDQLTRDKSKTTCKSCQREFKKMREFFAKLAAK